MEAILHIPIEESVTQETHVLQSNKALNDPVMDALKEIKAELKELRTEVSKLALTIERGKGFVMAIVAFATAAYWILSVLK